jgi:hypothetical protein
MVLHPAAGAYDAVNVTMSAMHALARYACEITPTEIALIQ